MVREAREGLRAGPWPQALEVRSTWTPPPGPALPRMCRCAGTLGTGHPPFLFSFSLPSTSLPVSSDCTTAWDGEEKWSVEMPTREKHLEIGLLSPEGGDFAHSLVGS